VNVNKKGAFEEDSEFINMNNSPNYFSSSSDEFEEEDEKEQSSEHFAEEPDSLKSVP